MLGSISDVCRTTHGSGVRCDCVDSFSKFIHDVVCGGSALLSASLQVLIYTFPYVGESLIHRKKMVYPVNYVNSVPLFIHP